MRKANKIDKRGAVLGDSREVAARHSLLSSTLAPMVILRRPPASEDTGNNIPIWYNDCMKLRLNMQLLKECWKRQNTALGSFTSWEKRLLGHTTHGHPWGGCGGLFIHCRLSHEFRTFCGFYWNSISWLIPTLITLAKAASDLPWSYGWILRLHKTRGPPVSPSALGVGPVVSSSQRAQRFRLGRGLGKCVQRPLRDTLPFCAG